MYLYTCIQMESLQNKSLMGFKIWRSWDPCAKKSKSSYSHDFLFFGYQLVLLNKGYLK